MINENYYSNICFAWMDHVECFLIIEYPKIHKIHSCFHAKLRFKTIKYA